MAWSIEVTVNTVRISQECAKDLFDAQNEGDGGEIWYEPEEVTTDEEGLAFNSDHMEHMDFLGDKTFTDILCKHKVKGDICFGSLEGDNAGKFWGYRFDGKGGMVKLAGRIVYEEKRSLAGMTFVITGTLSQMTREEAHSKIRESDGEVSESVNKNTGFLIVGDKPGSKLAKAKKLGVKILSEDDFLTLLD